VSVCVCLSECCYMMCDSGCDVCCVCESVCVV
jgi:hypothetical protein